MCIQFRCCLCGHKLKAPLSWAGRRARCPGCSKTITVPAIGLLRIPQKRKTRPQTVLPPAAPLATAVPATPCLAART